MATRVYTQKFSIIVGRSGCTITHLRFDEHQLYVEEVKNTSNVRLDHEDPQFNYFICSRVVGAAQ